jgi:hypothetical protein
MLHTKFIAMFMVRSVSIPNFTFLAEMVEIQTLRGQSGSYFVLYESRLKTSWTHLITPSRNFVEVR